MRIVGLLLAGCIGVTGLATSLEAECYKVLEQAIQLIEQWEVASSEDDRTLLADEMQKLYNRTVEILKSAMLDLRFRSQTENILTYALMLPILETMRLWILTEQSQYAITVIVLMNQLEKALAKR